MTSASARVIPKLKNGGTMDKKDIGKKVIPTLLVTLYTIPALAGAGDNIMLSQAAREEKPKAALSSEAVQQEVIQVLRTEGTDRVALNIAGQPGTFFKVFFSPDGAEKSYNLVPTGEGVIGQNGMGSVSFELKQLSKTEVYLKVTTSDTADFSTTRITPKPLILEVEQVQLKERGFGDRTKIRTPPAVAGVRG